MGSPQQIHPDRMSPSSPSPSSLPPSPGDGSFSVWARLPPSSLGCPQRGHRYSRPGSCELERLAESAVPFDTGFVLLSWQQDLCCSLPTGQTGGGREDWLPGDPPTLLHSKLCHRDVHLIFSAVRFVQRTSPQSAVQAVEG